MALTREYRDHALLIVVYATIALVTRFQQLGNPIVHVDEQFYFLVGDRMLHGAVPYVDIFDRKPVGLFVLYALIRELGGVGVIQYQIVAGLFAICTAFVVYRLASRLAGRRGAILAGAAYLLWIPLLTGQSGQAPVFYNLFVAMAAGWSLPGAPSDRSGVALVRRGVVAMLLIGVAFEIKTSVIFEGGYFGLCLMWQAAARRQFAALAVGIPIWIGAAALPTAIAAFWYWSHSAFDVFWFANVRSIFLRGRLDPDDELRNALTLALYLAPLLIVGALGAKRALRSVPRVFAVAVSGWLIVSVVSVVLLGYFFDHYGLPIVAPAALCAAPFLDRIDNRTWSAAVLAGAAAACLALPHFNQKRRGTPAQFQALVREIAPRAKQGLLVWDNLPALYTATGAPLPGRYPFANHLRDKNEIGAVGVDRMVELNRVLSHYPAVIVMEQRSGRNRKNVGDTTARLIDFIRSNYSFDRAIRVGRRDQLVYFAKR